MENNLRVILIPTTCWSGREGRGAYGALCSILRNIVILNYVKQDKQQRHLFSSLTISFAVSCCGFSRFTVTCKETNKNMDAAAP